MNLYHIVTDQYGYDTYSDAVYAAETEEQAVRLSIQNMHGWPANQYRKNKATLLGVAVPDTIEGEICSSFHAG